MQPAEADEFESDLGIVEEAMCNAVTTGYAARKTSHCVLWCTFCNSHHINSFLWNLSDPVNYLQVFATRYRDSIISPSGRPVRAKAVSDVLLSVAQKFTRM